VNHLSGSASGGVSTKAFGLGKRQIGCGHRTAIAGARSATACSRAGPASCTFSCAARARACAAWCRASVGARRTLAGCEACPFKGQALTKLAQSATRIAGVQQAGQMQATLPSIIEQRPGDPQIEAAQSQLVVIVPHGLGTHEYVGMKLS